MINARTNHRSITYLKLKVAILVQMSGTCLLSIGYLELDLDRISSWRHVTMTIDIKIKQSYSGIANIIMSHHIFIYIYVPYSGVYGDNLVIWRQE